MTEPAVTLSQGWIAASVAAILVQVVVPLALGLYVRRRLGVGWRFFWFGALVFFIFQVVTRIPAIQIAQALLGDALNASPVLTWAWIAALSWSAGLFEEVGRWVGYRWLFRPEQRSWRPAIMYGIGHGGLESILLGLVVGAVSLVQLLTLSSADLAQLPPEQQAAAQAQLTALTDQPFWFPLLGAWERLSALAVHVGLSLVVLQVFRRGSAVWLLAAILLHGAVNFVAVGLLRLLGPASAPGTVVVEAVIMLMAALLLWWALRLRGPDAEAADRAA